MIIYLYNIIASIILKINILKLRNLKVKFVMLNKFCIVRTFCKNML